MERRDFLIHAAVAAAAPLASATAVSVATDKPVEAVAAKEYPGIRECLSNNTIKDTLSKEDQEFFSGRLGEAYALTDRDDAQAAVTPEILAGLLNAAWRRDAEAVWQAFDLGFSLPTDREVRLAYKTGPDRTVVDSGDGPFIAINMTNYTNIFKLEDERRVAELSVRRQLYSAAQAVANRLAADKLLIRASVHEVTYNSVTDIGLVVWSRRGNDHRLSYAYYAGPSRLLLARLVSYDRLPADVYERLVG